MSIVDKSFVFMLIFTIISSFLAYVIIVRAYDTFIPESYYYSE